MNLSWYARRDICGLASLALVGSGFLLVTVPFNARGLVSLNSQTVVLIYVVGSLLLLLGACLERKVSRMIDRRWRETREEA